MFIFLIIMIFADGRWKNKLWFIPTGLLICFFINILRTTTLALIIKDHREIFPFMHHYVLKYLYYIATDGNITLYMSEGVAKNKVHIRVTIMVERDSQKGIIIGKGGAMLKKIGTMARRDIELMLGDKVFLETWVKVKKNWRDKKLDLADFGYNEKEY